MKDIEIGLSAHLPKAAVCLSGSQEDVIGKNVISGVCINRSAFLWRQIEKTIYDSQHFSFIFSKISLYDCYLRWANA